MGMTRFKADLHLHTTASDGTISPAEMVRHAQEAGMAMAAVTDHDTVSGVAQAVEAGERLGVRVLPGMEMTTGGSEEIHLLAYGIDPEDPRLAAFLEGQLAERGARMQTMLDSLRKLNMPLTLEEVTGWNRRFMGRMPLARAMVARGYVSSVRQAFERFLVPGKPAYVPRKQLAVLDGIALLTGFGAVVSLAHPGRLRMEQQTLAARLPGWIEAGLAGMEAYHSSHMEAQAACFDRMARRHGLLVTGGSDCHGCEESGPWIGEHLKGWHTIWEDVQALQERTNLIQ